MYVDFDLHVPVDQPQDWSLKRSTKEHKNVARAANIKYICSGLIRMCCDVREICATLYMRRSDKIPIATCRAWSIFPAPIPFQQIIY